MKDNLFLDVNDGSSCKNLQIVIDKINVKNVNFGSSVETTGVLALTPRGELELKSDSLCIIGNCQPLHGFPFAARHSYPPEYLRETLHFRSRVSTFTSMLRVRHSAQFLINQYFNENKYVQIHTPILTGNDCEGGGETFTARPESSQLLKQMVRDKTPIEEAFFDKRVFLTVSGQLHLEAMAHGIGDCYTFGPTFRAENAKSPVHLSEFYMLEVEQCFVTNLKDHLKFVQKFFLETTKRVIDKNTEDMANCRKQTKLKDDDFSWIEREIPILSYKEAAEILVKHSSELKIPFDIVEGLAKDHELFLCEFLEGPVFVINWPTAMKPFYMRQNSENLKITECYDLLVPRIGELIGGSMRENCYDRLKRKIPEGLDWYLDLRRFGSIPTAGFGLGFERYLQLLLGVTNIRDVIPFPRWAHNCSM